MCINGFCVYLRLYHISIKMREDISYSYPIDVQALTI